MAPVWAVWSFQALGPKSGFHCSVPRRLLRLSYSFFAETFAELVGVLDDLFHGDVAHGDEGTHVGGTLARMGAVMLGHVDEFGGFLHHLIGGFEDGLGLADEGDDGAVGCLAGVDVEELHAIDLFNLGSHLVDDIHVAAFADIRHAFNELFHDVLFLVCCKDTLFFMSDKIILGPFPYEATTETAWQFFSQTLKYY